VIVLAALARCGSSAGTPDADGGSVDLVDDARPEVADEIDAVDAVDAVEAGPVNVVANGGFEQDVEDGAERPPYWFVGFRGEPLPPGSGAWALDDAVTTEGGRSLRLEPTGEYAVTQILHLPGAALAGRTVTLTLSVRHEGLQAPPSFLIAGYNPEVTEPDPVLGPGVVGSFLGTADAEPGAWKTYTGQFTATGPAQAVFVYLAATGSAGRAWFDDVRVLADPWAPGPGPSEASVDVPLAARPFDTGLVSENPADLSELAYEQMVQQAATSGSVLNLFFHVRWCELTGTPFDDDPEHAFTLRLGRLAREQGLKLGLTFDFTHGAPETVGDLNPLPDGTSPGSLNDPAVRQAYASELTWLFDQLDPEYVLVGIETSIFHDRHPEQWDAYVQMEAEVYDALKARNPLAHVSAYHTLDWSVNPDGSLNQAHAEVWRALLPHLDSVAFSTYPSVSLPGVPVADYPPGMFARPRDIAPDLPILVPEFGMGGGGDSGYTEAEQAEALGRMLIEMAEAAPVALIWFSLYDQPYYGVPAWFKIFKHLGLHGPDGTPKQSFVVWKKLHAL
jgi:hypothetical protein